MEILNRMPWAAQNAVFKKLSEIAEVGALSREDRQKYDRDIKRYRDTLSAYTAAWQKGLSEGQAEGRAEGRLEIARNLKNMGLSAADIAKATGLTPEEVADL